MKLRVNSLLRANMTSHFLKLVCALLLALVVAGCSNANKSLTGVPTKPGSPQDFAVNVGTTVHFTTDSVQLSEQALGILRNQVKWLQQYKNYSVTLEGHADERGTREYNIALGGRRADVIKNYLIQNGINPTRLRTISYGKERPVAICNDISCWSQNRRVETKLNGAANY